MSNPRIPYRLGSAQANLPLLHGKRLIVQFIVNIEAWLFDGKMPRTIVTPPQGIDQIPDIPNFCWAEYGMRLGMMRLIDEFRSRGIPVGASINAGVIDIYPECAEAIRAAGWEFIAHGMYQKAIQGELDEPGLVRAVLEKIEAFTGQRPRGWLGPGLRQSLATADHLAAHNIEYTFDWNVDDIPCEMTTLNGRLFAMPYTQDLNDSIIYAIERHATGEFLNRIARTLAAYDAEPGPHVISMGLHPHLMGVPHRLHEMRQILDLFQSHPDVGFTTPAETMDWYKAATESRTPTLAQ
jgi:allantoinase